jgi:hypothetical protein
VFLVLGTLVRRKGPYKSIQGIFSEKNALNPPFLEEKNPEFANFTQ